MVINARKEADLVDPETLQYLELDIFLPSLHLAFEYQVPPNSFPHPPSLLFIITPNCA